VPNQPLNCDDPDRAVLALFLWCVLAGHVGLAYLAGHGLLGRVPISVLLVPAAVWALAFVLLLWRGLLVHDGFLRKHLLWAAAVLTPCVAGAWHACRHIVAFASVL
jgi:hypothetical protein